MIIAAGQTYQGINMDGGYRPTGLPNPVSLTREAGYTGASDSSTGILSMWVRPTYYGSQYIQNTSQTVNLYHSALTAKFTLDLSDSTALKAFRVRSNVGYVFTDPEYVHILISWNTNFSAGNKLAHFYVNDVNVKEVLYDGDSAFNVDYTQANWAIGLTSLADYNSSSITSDISEYYFAPGQFLDFSIEANRRSFITADGDPSPLGTDGSFPTGTAPIAYFSGTIDQFNYNRGTGGNMTVNGIIRDAVTTPGQ